VIGCDLLLPIRDGEVFQDTQTVVLLENTAGRKRRRISVVVMGED
jgi:thiamine phosphate synthase YjbQ (UPF0047 family)